MVISKPTYKNLKIPESGANFCIYLVNCLFGLTIYVDPSNNTLTNMYILNYVDDDKETINKISFLPLNFLRQYYIENYNDDTNLIDNIKDKLELKIFLYKKFLHHCKNKIDFLKTAKYKDIYLKYLIKPFMNVGLSKTIDASLFPNIKDDIDLRENIQKGFNKNEANPYAVSQDWWLSIREIRSALYPITLVKTNFYYCNVIVIPTISEDVNNLSVNFLSTMRGKYFIKELDYFFKSSGKRFLIATILYNYHFTSVIIDTKPMYIKGSDKNDVVCWYFDSCGYEPEEMGVTNKYCFIKIDMKTYKIYNNQRKLSNRYSYVKMIEKIISSRKSIKLSVFNNFSCQDDNAECGMFSILFFLLCMHTVDVTDKKCYLVFKKIYYTLTFFGDLLLSMLRGVIFATKYDLDNYKSYDGLTDVIEIKNKKYKELIKVIKNNFDRLNNISKDISGIRI